MAEQTTPTQGVEQGAALSVEQRLANLYGGKTTPDEAPAPEEAPETETAPVEAEQAQGQADELTADDLPDEGEQSAQHPLDEFEIVHNGTQHKLAREKVIELAQKGFDYTAKTQQLASQQRATMELMTRVQELEALAPEVTNELAQVRAAEKALAQWQNVDWIQLATNDPLEYPKYRAQFDQLREAYSMAAQAFNAKAGALQQRKAQVSQAVVQQEMARLQEIMPQLRDPKAFQAAATEIKQAGLSDGYTEQELDQVVDARYVRTLWKAAQYDKLVKSKAEKIKQARTAPPTAKPGAVGQTQSAEAKRIQETRTRLKKTGDWRDAASLLARLK
jgi:hypothetical protein